MSENLDLVRSIYADWERGDFSSAEWADPEIEFVMADGPSPASWTGLREMAEGWRDWLRAWEGYRIEPDEYRELDSERVLVLSQRSAGGKASGLDLGQVRVRSLNLFCIVNGRVTKLVHYWDGEHALANLGLNE